MGDKLYNISKGEWLVSDTSSGEGRGTVNFTAPAWNGREDRLTLRVVRSGKNMKAVTVKQLGVKIDEISVDRLDFPLEGGDKQVMVRTNAAALKALITSENPVRGYIKAFTTASGLTINVNDSKLDYGFPGDPGLLDSFDVSLIVSMDDNTNGFETHEVLTINGKTVSLNQPGKKISYINLNKDFEEVENETTLTSLEIESNLGDYNIEIVECDTGEGENFLEVDKNFINFGADGGAEVFNIETNPKDLSWRISQ